MNSPAQTDHDVPAARPPRDIFAALLVVVLTLSVTGTTACLDTEGDLCNPDSFVERCEGNARLSCSTDHHFAEVEEEDCAATSNVCVALSGAAGCVDGSLMPCSTGESYCADGEPSRSYLSCDSTLGYMRRTGCGRFEVCATDLSGRPECVHEAVVLCGGRTSGCSPDGRFRLVCASGSLYMAIPWGGGDCSAENGQCLVADGRGECAHLPLTPCEAEETWFTCTAEGDYRLRCDAGGGYLMNAGACRCVMGPEPDRGHCE